jgi:hypothetical protein
LFVAIGAGQNDAAGAGGGLSRKSLVSSGVHRSISPEFSFDVWFDGWCNGLVD